MKNLLSHDEMLKIKQELVHIKKVNYNISDVSDLMKKLVIESYGDEDWSTSGYWVRAEQLCKQYFI